MADEAEEEKTDEVNHESEEGRKPTSITVPYTPSLKDVEEHNLTHIPFRAWCVHCVKARGLEGQHRQKTNADVDNPMLSVPLHLIICT